MNSKWYWLIRQKYRNLKFQIKKAAFRLNERKESSERLSSFSRIVIRTLLVQVAINLVLVAVLYVGDKLLLSGDICKNSNRSINSCIVREYSS